MDSSIPKIPPPAYLLMAIITMIILNAYFPIGHWLFYPWKYFGIIFIVLGFALGLGSGLFFRKLGTNPRPGARAKVLVTTGTFKFTRNPMYVGLMTILIGTSILLGSLSPLIMIPILFLILHTQFVLREEKWMEEWFGSTYLDYKSRTPRWLW